MNLQETNCTQRLYESTAVSDFHVYLPILSLDRVIHSARLVDETVQEITAVLNHLDWFDDIELVALTIQEALTNALVHGNAAILRKRSAFSCR